MKLSPALCTLAYLLPMSAAEGLNYKYSQQAELFKKQKTEQTKRTPLPNPPNQTQSHKTPQSIVIEISGFDWNITRIPGLIKKHFFKGTRSYIIDLNYQKVSRNMSEKP